MLDVSVRAAWRVTCAFCKVGSACQVNEPHTPQSISAYFESRGYELVEVDGRKFTQCPECKVRRKAVA